MFLNNEDIFSFLPDAEEGDEDVCAVERARRE